MSSGSPWSATPRPWRWCATPRARSSSTSRWTSSFFSGGRPPGGRSRGGSCFRAVTSSSTGRRPRPRRSRRAHPERRASPMAHSGSGACGGRGDEPSAARARPDQRFGLGSAGPGGTRAAGAGAGRAQADRLLRPTRVDAFGHQSGAQRAAVLSPRRRRRVLPLVELRAEFALAREELRDADRGAEDVELEALDRAAHQIAVAENVAVFHGWEGAFTGIAELSPHERIALGEAAEGYPRQVAGAVERLLCSGITGPYGLALGREQYRRVVETAEHGGYPLLDHLRKILEGPIVWTPGVRGAVVLTLRGGDFLFESGQDLSIGYQSHDDSFVRLYLEESFSFRVATPEAAVALTA